MPDRVLVTGISGFVGGHVALALLGAGYVVRGSVRDPGKAAAVKAALGQAGADTGRLEFVALELGSDAGWAAAMTGVRYLQHVASPLPGRLPADREEVIEPAVEGTRRALEAAFAAGVERVVLTSSMAALAYGHDPNRTEPFGQKDWTDLRGRPVNAYVESKTRAERKAWEIAERHGRSAGLVAVNPSVILGPLLDRDPGTSVGLLVRLLGRGLPLAPALSLNIVDVRDVAALQLAAMQVADAGGQRYPAGQGPYSIKTLSAMMRTLFPERSRRLPRYEAPNWLVRLIGRFNSDLRSGVDELGVVKRIDGAAAGALLGRPFLPVAETLQATGRSLIARGLV
jgi:nucleoside-diphosphate-sugar epimerase